MKINKEYISTNNTYEKQNHPKYIVIHETDNFATGANAERHAVAQYSGHLETSVHYYCGDDGIFQTALHEDGTYSVGKEYGGNHTVKDATNRNTINIEICVNNDGNYMKARQNAIDLIKFLIKETGIPAERVVRHYDVKGKYCPRKMMDDTDLWVAFKNSVLDREVYKNEVSKNVFAIVCTKKDPLNMREMPNGNIIFKIPRNAVVEIIAFDGEWTQVRYDNLTGYVFNKYLGLCGEDVEREKSILGICTGNYVRVRKTPEFKNNIMYHLMRGNRFEIIQKCGVWYEIKTDTDTGWIYAEYVTEL